MSRAFRAYVVQLKIYFLIEEEMGSSVLQRKNGSTVLQILPVVK
jgi:hypothetical protein